MAVGEEGSAGLGDTRSPKVIGRYTLYDLLSAGGMGQVNLGRLVGASGFSRVVAIKRLHRQFATDPEFAEMFLDEARLAARIHHPNVVATLDAVSEDGELFLVMDYVRGESLAKLLRSTAWAIERPPLGHAIAIMVGALHGLHAAHEARNAAGESLALVHRDVSPANILVGGDGVARIIDFGVAKAAERIHFTRGDEIRGKVAYMAPEQLTRAPLDRRADIYSASVVLWEILTARRFIEPHVAKHPAMLLEALDRPPRPPSALAAEVPGVLDEIVLRGLARDPNDRFATALEMATALESVVVPSSQREVGAWVETVAGETLRQRDETLKRIETDPGARRSTPPGSASSPQDAWTTVSQPPPRAYRRTIAVSLLLVVVALAWVGGAIYGRMQRSSPISAGTGTSSTSATIAASADSPSSVLGLASPAPSGTSLAVADPSTPLATDSAASGPPTPAQASRRARPKRASCNPPYRMDHGIQVAKVECL